MMKSFLLVSALCLAGANTYGQCRYIPSTSTATDTLSYTFTGGSSASFGCAPIDPTRWLSGSGNSILITFVTPQTDPTFRVWGMNDDDIASIQVNGSSFPLSSATAGYDPKVVCGQSPGPNGVAFLAGNLVGANNNTDGNYSYQDVQLFASGVSTILITGIAGAGWGFAGASVYCPGPTDIDHIAPSFKAALSPNPLKSSAKVSFSRDLRNATLSIFNLQGQKVKTMTHVSGGIATVHRDDLPAGLYFVHVLEDHQLIASEKLIIAD